VNIAIVIVDLRVKVGDNKSEVLASNASNINAVTTIMQRMNIILFDKIDLDRLNDAFSFFLPLSWGRLIALVPLGSIVKYNGSHLSLLENKQQSYGKHLKYISIVV
jgi:hypothetical protein